MSYKKVSKSLKELLKNESENLSYVNVDLNAQICTPDNMLVVSSCNLSTTHNPKGILREGNRIVVDSQKGVGENMKDPRDPYVSNATQVQHGKRSMTIRRESKTTNATVKQKIPRPPNAFMLFANKWRKKLASENPKESNKDISVRLGVLWKSMSEEIKEKYFSLARQVDAEHKRKYPDYVYNPKEARLRKAMREQSRELSRQSILQTTIASSASESASTDCVSSSAGNFSYPYPLTCATPSASSLSATSSINANRIIGPWFPVGHAAPTTHFKPILTPRVMAVHQRTIDKTKEVIRKQMERPVGNSVPFPGVMPPNSNYTGNFSPHGPVSSAQENNDYCMMSELSESQKWHPYQNGANSYHLRGTPTPKMSNLHCNMPASPHRPTQWSQFCSVPMQNSNENAAMRSPQHLTYLQEQQNQHCSVPIVYPDDMQIPYRPNQIDVNHRPMPSYQQQEEHRMTDVEKESLHSIRPHKIEETVPKSRNDSPPRRESGPVMQMAPSSVSPTVTPAESSSDSFNSRSGSASPVAEQKSPQYSDKLDQRNTKNRPSKQPLPGFHQAFGSTEIGRFSRSEFFASMIGEEHGFVPNGFPPAPACPFPPMPSVRQEILPKCMNDDVLRPTGSEPYYFVNHVSSNADVDNNYEAFIDYSRRVKQEWHPSVQATFFEGTNVINASEYHHCCHHHHHNCPKRVAIDNYVPEGLDLSLPDNKKARRDADEPKNGLVDFLQLKEELFKDKN